MSTNLFMKLTAEFPPQSTLYSMPLLLVSGENRKKEQPLFTNKIQFMMRLTRKKVVSYK